MQKNSQIVSIIIPNYNGKELLEKNLPYVLKAYRNSGNKIKEIIVVDDASTDDSVTFIKHNFPEIRIIQHRVNRGFSSAVNMGARSAKGKYLALLNSDVIPSKNFLETVLQHFKDDKVFAVSLHEKGYGWARGKFKDGFIEHESGSESEDVHESFWVNGGTGVFRRRYWMKLNGMDEKLLNPFYWEDLDLSYRAAKRGWLNLWDPEAKVVHEHELTIGRISKTFREKIQQRNQLILIWKNITSPNLFRKHIAGLVRRITQHPGYILIVFIALKKWRGIAKARKKERKEAKISDEAICAKFKNG